MRAPQSSDIRYWNSEIIHDGKTIPYSAQLSKKREKFLIEISPDGSVVVKAQFGITPEQISDLMQANAEKICKALASRESPKIKPPADGTFTVRGMDILYSVTYSARRRRNTVCIYQDGRLEVQMCAGASQNQVNETLNTHKDWIVNKYARITGLGRLPEEESGTIQIASRDIKYDIRRSVRAKRCTLKIHPDGRIEVVVPENIQTELVAKFVSENASWIASNISLPSPHYSTEQTGQPAGQRHKPDAGLESGQIEYQGSTILYHIKRSKRARHIVLKVSRDHTVLFIAPRGIPSSKIHEFATQKASWIHGHTAGSIRPLPPERTFSDGEIYSWFGGEIRIRIKNGEKPFASLEDGELMVIIPQGIGEFHQHHVVQSILVWFFGKTLQTYVLPLLNAYADLFKIQVPQVKMRNPKTRWGSCTPQGIILNIRLCMAPPEIIEYVVAHELCHKVHPDHSDQFWASLGRVMPNYQDRREHLKKNGYLWAL